MGVNGNISGVANNLTSSAASLLKDKSKKASKNHFPIKFKVKKQFAEQLYVDDQSTIIDGENSDENGADSPVKNSQKN